jgi:hypothetical protein
MTGMVNSEPAGVMMMSRFMVSVSLQDANAVSKMIDAFNSVPGFIVMG